MSSEILGVDADVFSAWAQAAGALGAFTAAGIAVGIAIFDSKRRDREREEEKAGQALTITAAVERQVADSNPGRKDIFEGILGMPYLVVVVHNNGRDPITDVVLEHVTATQSMSDEPGRKVEKWAVGDSRSEHGPVTLFPVVRGQMDARSAPLTFVDSTNQQRVDEKTAKITFTFLDAHGVRWRRANNGKPERAFRAPRKRRYFKWLRRSSAIR